MTLAPDDLLASLCWRYATKAFDPGRRIPTGTWTALERSLVLSPSSCGLQPWKFLVIDDPALRPELRPHSPSCAPTPGTRARSPMLRTWWCFWPSARSPKPTWTG